MVFILLGIYQGVELLGHMTHPHLLFQGTVELVSTEAATTIDTPTPVPSEGSNFPSSLLTLI